ncbi:MAG: COG4315 family predicted lipoprotein [Solirubrobacterales bacterium]
MLKTRSRHFYLLTLTAAVASLFIAFAMVDVASAGGGKRIKTGRTSFGTIIQDSRGRTLYLFTKERSTRSRCYGECAKAWPPVLTSNDPVATGGAIQSKLGTTRRRGGKTQVTYNGHPLYYYVAEDEANEVLCQNVYEFGGKWYIVNRQGNAIKGG